MNTPSNLKPLEFLVGAWTAESTSPSGEHEFREITYEWIHAGNFLRGTSRRNVGGITSGLTVFYLWDPVERIIRSWVLSSDGIWSRSVVEIEMGVVRLFTKGVTADGKILTLTSVLRTVSDEVRTEQWTKIKVGGMPIADMPLIEWRKKQPAT